MSARANPGFNAHFRKLKGSPNPRLLRLEASHMPVIWIVWKTGSHSPRSFHLSRTEALAAMQSYVRSGDEVNLYAARLDLSLRGQLQLTEANVATRSEAP